MTRRPAPPTPGLAPAVLAGVATAAALLGSPWWSGLPPLPAPHVPLDLRYVAVLGLVPAAHAGGRLLPWPGPGLAAPAAALLAGILAHLPASTVLAASGIAGARSGLDPDPVGLAASLAALLLALAAGLEATRHRVRSRLEGRGLPREEARTAAAGARGLARSGLLAAGLVSGLLAAAVVAAGGLLRGRTLPLPEVVAALVVVAVALVVADWRGLSLDGGA